MKAGRLHIITDMHVQDRFTHLELAALALEGGATTLQLRDKQAGARELVATAVQIGVLCRRRRVPLLINDRADVAWASDADGVHLGEGDLSLADARRLLGPNRILGASADHAEEAVARSRAGADYVGLGPVFATRTKIDTGPVLGLEGLRAAALVSPAPLVAIGGLTLDNLDDVLATGVYGVALLGAVCMSRDPAATVHRAAEFIAARFSSLA